MSKFIAFILVWLLPVIVKAQDSCSYLIVRPDTFFIDQYTDTTVAEKLVYTGNKDISYSTCYFHFDDTAVIKIGDTSTTTGVAGPFIFSRFGGYKVTYKKDSISANTIVKGWYGVYHAGSGAPVIDCQVPVIFVVNRQLVPDRPGAIPLAIYPNPVYATATLKTEVGLKHATIVVYNSIGKRMFQADDVTSGYSVTLNCQGWASGAYTVVLYNAGAVHTARMQVDAVRW